MLHSQLEVLKSFGPHWQTKPVGELGASIHKFDPHGCEVHLFTLLVAIQKNIKNNSNKIIFVITWAGLEFVGIIFAFTSILVSGMSGKNAFTISASIFWTNFGYSFLNFDLE